MYKEDVKEMAGIAEQFGFDYDRDLLLKIAEVIDEDKYKEISDLLLELARYIDNY